MSEHISETVSAGQLRAFIERIERVEEEIKTLNADKSDIYKELRGVGFDVKAVRQCVAARKLDSAEREERNAIFDLYWEALTGASRVHVHEGRGVDPSSTPPHDPETGELTDTQEQPEEPATQSQPIDTVHGSGAAAKGLAGPACAQDAETANTKPAPNSPSPETPQATADDEAAQANPIVVGNLSSSVTPPPGETDKAGDVPPPSSPAALSEADVPAFLRPEQRKSIADYRPNCLRPDACAATGLTHCYICRKAMEAASETEMA